MIFLPVRKSREANFPIARERERENSPVTSIVSLSRSVYLCEIISHWRCHFQQATWAQVNLNAGRSRRATVIPTAHRPGVSLIMSLLIRLSVIRHGMFDRALPVVVSDSGVLLLIFVGIRSFDARLRDCTLLVKTNKASRSIPTLNRCRV